MGKRRKRERKALVAQSASVLCPVETASPSVTVENCLMAALRLHLEKESEWIGTGQLAAALRLALPAVSQMLRTLSERGFAVYKPYCGISLTDSGREVAARLLRRHRLIETFLVRVLKLSWDQVHVEAEKLEHVVSDLVIDRLDDFLHRPNSDPHGDPIPSTDGTMRVEASKVRLLADCEARTAIRFVRVLNQEPPFLRYLSSCGVAIGIEAVVEGSHPEAGTITILCQGKQIVLSYTTGAQLLVETS